MKADVPDLRLTPFADTNLISMFAAESIDNMSKDIMMFLSNVNNLFKLKQNHLYLQILFAPFLPLSETKTPAAE